jgi:PAS domain S-box-containing protein
MMPTDAMADSADAQRPPGAPIDFRVLFDSIGDLVLVLDGRATICSANAASAEILGIAPEALVGRLLFDFVHVSVQEPYLAALEALKASHTPAINMRMRTAARGLNSRPIGTVTHRYAAGSELHFVLVGRDESIMGDKAPWMAAGPSIRGIGHWRYDLQARALEWQADPTLGPSAGTDFVAQIDDFGLPLVHADDQAECRKILRGAIDSKQPFFMRCRIMRQTGTYAVCESFGVVEMDAGEAVALSAVGYEITKPPGAEMAQNNALELQELFSEISDIVERRDARGHYLYVSPAVKRVLGYDPHELVGLKNWLELVHPDDVPNVFTSIRVLNTPGASTTLTYRLSHKDGHWVWLESKIRVLMMGPNGLPAETAAVARDITARKRAEEELNAAYARAEAASATKSRFLANMSHELRTPLNAIIGFSDIIRRELFGAIGSARYKEYSQLIHESGGHLLDLINDILDMSKIEAGKFDLRFEAIDLDDLVHSSLKLLEPRAGEAKLVLNAELSEDKPFVQADRRAIKQILLNLLTNAIKFTPPGGMVTVSVGAMSDGVAMQVRDTGIGIAEKDLNRITLPFEQATHDPLLTQAGSGLGLALVQSLVNLHMGTLKIDSVPGQGTCVTVFLPADPRSRKAA